MPVSDHPELGLRMDLIRPLRMLLDPLIEHTSFVLDEEHPIVAEDDRIQGFLEYHGTLNDGRIVLFGFYQHSLQRTMTAEMWVPDDTRGLRPDATVESVARRRHVWSYDSGTDGEDLVRAIVAEVAAWLQSFT